MPQNTSPHAASHAPRYPVRIPIRMTQEERATIGKSACALNRSISRYLVELATTSSPANLAAEGKNQKPVLLPEDKARLSFLRALFHGATEKVQAALASERFARSEGRGEAAEIAGAKNSLEETLRLLDAIGQELGRRIA